MSWRPQPDPWLPEKYFVETIFRNLGWLLASRGINALLSLAYLALTTRTLGLENFGYFTLIVVLAQALAGFVSFNGWQAVVRWGVESAEARTATGFALALDISSIFVGMFLALGLTALAGLWLPLPDTLFWPTFGLCAATIVAIRSTPTGVLRLYERYDLAAKADAVLPVTRAIGAGLAALFAPNVTGFLVAWAIAEFACAAAFWKYSARYVSIGLPDISLKRLPEQHPDVWQFILGTSLSRTLAVISKQCMILLVGALGGAALAGGYRVASQLGQALVQLGEALSRAIYPEFVKTKDAAIVLSNKITLLCLMTGAVAIPVAYWRGEWAIRLLAGPEFVFVHSAMVILACAGALELLAANWESLLVAKHKAITPFLLRIAPLILVISAMQFLITNWQLEGAAAGILMMSALSAFGLGLAVSRQHRNQLPPTADMFEAR